MSADITHKNFKDKFNKKKRRNCWRKNNIEGKKQNRNDKCEIRKWPKSEKRQLDNYVLRRRKKRGKG